MVLTRSQNKVEPTSWLSPAKSSVSITQGEILQLNWILIKLRHEVQPVVILLPRHLYEGPSQYCQKLFVDELRWRYKATTEAGDIMFWTGSEWTHFYNRSPNTDIPPIFDDFIHLVNDPDVQPTADDLKIVQELMYFVSEVGRMEDRHDGHNEGLCKRLGHVLQAGVHAEPNPDGTKFDGQELGEGGCNPTTQVCLSMKRSWIDPLRKSICEKCCCPTFLVAGGGPWLSVLGGVVTDRFIVQRLTDMRWMALSSTEEDNRGASLLWIGVFGFGRSSLIPSYIHSIHSLGSDHEDIEDPKSAALHAMPEITYGSIHLCMVSEVFEHPFDLTKVCLQSHILDEMVWFNGPIDRLTKTWKIEAPIFGAMVENVSLFLSYGEIQSLIRRISHRAPQEKLPLYHLALAAAGAGAITSFLL
ncbi:hypothetical protein BYT27DRAFT_7260401 [Phlegmacium glaucopus]|nr:hypothetical protein BYT27DRAFT_7260401 [Phlegmacium glaucopus]